MSERYKTPVRERGRITPRASDPTAPPAPVATTAPEVVDIPTDLNSPLLAPVMEVLRSQKCQAHGVTLAECAPCLLQDFVPRLFMRERMVQELVMGWPDHCEDCAAPTIATHAEPDDGDDEGGLYCATHAKDHPRAAPVHAANALMAGSQMIGIATG